MRVCVHVSARVKSERSGVEEDDGANETTATTGERCVDLFFSVFFFWKAQGCVCVTAYSRVCSMYTSVCVYAWGYRPRFLIFNIIFLFLSRHSYTLHSRLNHIVSRPERGIRKKGKRLP